jgi:MFS family permease
MDLIRVDGSIMVERFVLALSVVGLVDAISYMVVAPSIIFYVLQLGGTKEQYGVILSAFSFASFCTKPFLGSWCDRSGFRIPYLFSLSLAALGGLLYLLASLFMGNTAIGFMLAGRLLGGVGAASSALGYAYLATVVPHDEQTKVNSLLSMLRMIGMAAGPGVNVFLDKINVDIGSFHLDELNSVGLVLIGMNVLGFLSIFVLLDEPGEKDGTNMQGDTRQDMEKNPSALSLIRTCCCAEILVPILSIFGFNANFQLYALMCPMLTVVFGFSANFYFSSHKD